MRRSLACQRLLPAECAKCRESPRHALEIAHASCIHYAQHFNRVLFPLNDVEDGVAKVRHWPPAHIHLVGLASEFRMLAQPICGREYSALNLLRNLRTLASAPLIDALNVFECLRSVAHVHALWRLRNAFSSSSETTGLS